MGKRSSHHRHLKPKSFFGRITHLFRERQIYVRSKGQVQFVTLRPYMMVFGLFVLVAGFFWIAFASINVTFKDELIAVKERNLYQSRLDHDERIAEMRKTIDKLNEKLMLDQRGYLAEVDKVRSEFRALLARQDRLTEFFRQGWLPLRKTTGGTQPNSSLPLNNNGGQGSTGKQNLSPFRQGKSSLIQNNQIDPTSLGQKFARQFKTRKQALQPLMQFRAEMATIEDHQIKLIDEVIAYATVQEKKTRKIYAKLGVNSNRVLKKQRKNLPDSVGGPFVAVDMATLGSKKIADRLQRATAALNRSELLQRASSKLPLAMPVYNIIRFSSPFGLRRDPLRRVAAMHTGIDIKAKYASNVRATASGVVVSAGWTGGYGRLIKIRHQNGLTTRYAHLLKILVKKGQHVKLGQPIGLLGSSGRSTGPHLHYETRLNGKALNPARFWKARNDFQTLSKKR